jgi:phosphoribosylformylglycinamidine synthase subunit PurS
VSGAEKTLRYAARVEVRLRPGIADPESATIERALPALGFDDVSAVTSGRWFGFEVEAEDEAGAHERASALATRLLANPVMEDALVTVSAAAHR